MRRGGREDVVTEVIPSIFMSQDVVMITIIITRSPYLRLGMGTGSAPDLLKYTRYLLIAVSWYVVRTGPFYHLPGIFKIKDGHGHWMHWIW